MNPPFRKEQSLTVETDLTVNLCWKISLQSDREAEHFFAVELRNVLSYCTQRRRDKLFISFPDQPNLFFEDPEPSQFEINGTQLIVRLNQPQEIEISIVECGPESSSDLIKVAFKIRQKSAVLSVGDHERFGFVKVVFKPRNVWGRRTIKVLLPKAQSGIVERAVKKAIDTFGLQYCTVYKKTCNTVGPGADLVECFPEKIIFRRDPCRTIQPLEVEYSFSSFVRLVKGRSPFHVALGIMLLMLFGIWSFINPLDWLRRLFP